MKDIKREFFNKGVFYINGTFDDEMRSVVVPKLYDEIMRLKNNKNAKITFFISSHGGDGYLVTDLIDLFEVARSNDITIVTIVQSHAYSAGSMLAIAGSKGERYISKKAEHLVHYGQFDGYRKTTPLQIERNSEHYKRWTKKMIEHYKKYSNIPDIEDKLRDDDFYIEAKNCIKWQLADKYTDDIKL